MSTTTTITQETPATTSATLRLRGNAYDNLVTINPLEQQDPQTLLLATEKAKNEEYKYKHFLPTFDPNEKFDPLTEFEHSDPGLEALKHDNPQEFLQNATVSNVSLFREYQSGVFDMICQSLINFAFHHSSLLS